MDIAAVERLVGKLSEPVKGRTDSDVGDYYVRLGLLPGDILYGFTETDESIVRLSVLAISHNVIVEVHTGVINEVIQAGKWSAPTVVQNFSLAGRLWRLKLEDRYRRVAAQAAAAFASFAQFATHYRFDLTTETNELQRSVFAHELEIRTDNSKYFRSAGPNPGLAAYQLFVTEELKASRQLPNDLPASPLKFERVADNKAKSTL